MKNWLKNNWFRLAIIILSTMIYSKLDGVKENTFYTADMVDSSATRMINSLDDRLERIENSIDRLVYTR